MKTAQAAAVGRPAADPVTPVLVRAARRESLERPPVWFMRQAGRSLPEFRKIREAYDLFTICQRPELCAEVTMQPVRRLGVDGAVLFADIMLPVAFGLGVDLRLVDGVGPVVEQPIRSQADIDRLQQRAAADAMPFVLETIRLLRRDLDPSVAMIGFAGAPFTLAGYLIEGKPSRDFLMTKAMMYNEPALWQALMARLSSLVLDYLVAQIDAGAQLVQLFDSWVGALSPDDYRRYVLPYTAPIFAGLARNASSTRLMDGRDTSSTSVTVSCRRRRSSTCNAWWSGFMPADRTAILLMAYGSPNRLDEVEAYFTDIRGGRKPSREAVEELTERYRRVGVPTPLLAVSTSLARQLQERLRMDPPDGGTYTVHLGMKHWTPRISSAVDDAIDAGADRLIAIVLAPHYSTISIEGYRRQVEAALAEGGSRRSINPDFVGRWHVLAGDIDAVADNVRATRAEFREPAQVVAVFTAHSLPARILNEGDPYQDQLLRTSELVAQRAGIENWRFSYQSQSQTGEPWLGPHLPDMVETLARQGHRAVLVAPVGFIADHLEIFYDIDIEAKEKADALGIELRRAPMLNADPRLVQALYALVSERVRRLSTVASS